MSKRRTLFSTILIAALIGLINGLVGTLFLAVIKGAVYIVNLWSIPLYLLPLLGSLILVLFRGRMLDDHVDFGIWAVKEELYYIDRQMMSPKDVAVKFMGTLISIISGFSVGRFSPMIYIGGAVGSQIGYNLKFDEDQIKLFIGCGVAGTLSAVFQDPIFATIFVLEIFLHASYFDRIPAIMISSLVAMEVASITLGSLSPFAVLTEYLVYDKTSILVALGLGLLTGILTFFYNGMILKAKEFHKRFDFTLMPVVGGIIVGVLGFLKPEIFEVYTDVFRHYLTGEIIMQAVMVLLLLKIVAIFVSFGFGAMGGTFAPAMYIGYIIGIMTLKLTGVSSSAIIGMCGMFAGFANAPLAATIFFTTISGINQLVVPFFIVSIISASTYKFLDHTFEGDQI